MKHLFIVNPVAGKGKSLQFIHSIHKLFENRNEEYIIKITERPGHATEIARQYACSDKYRIYSVGGDGTLNEVLNGMVGTESSLAIIPCGSGNDFIKSVTQDIDMQSILHRTVNGRERLVDLAKTADKYFINISSIGFDANVVYNTNRFKKLPFVTGRSAYILGVVTVLLKYDINLLNIKIDDKNIEMKCLLIAVANGRYYGGGMMPAPGAEIDDGLLDICLIKEMPRYKIARFFPKFIKGRHGEIEGVSFLRGKKVEIRCNNYITLNIDGEVYRVREAAFEIIPKGMHVIVPCNQ